MYISGKIELQAYTDSAQTEFPKELVPSIEKEFANTAATEIQCTTLTLAGAASQAISLNGVGSITKIYLYSDATDLNVNINGLGNILYSAQVPGLMPLSVTSLTITNAHATTSTTVTLVLIAG